MRDSKGRVSTNASSFISNVGLSGVAWLGMKNIPAEKMKKKYATSDDKYYAYRGMQIRYRDEGAGPIVILIHGICSFLETWDGWVSHLKNQFRVIRPDIPGFGITGPSPDKSVYSKEGGVEFVDKFITDLNIQNCSIVGNSLGGYFAWNYAAAYPQKVSKLILIDPVGYNQKLPWLLKLATNPLMRTGARYMMPRFLVDKATYEVYGDKSKLTPETKNRYFEFAMRQGNKGSYNDIFNEMKKQNNLPNLSKGISTIKTPTLVMWGKKDEWVPHEYMDKWKKDLPGAKYISYDGAGHVPMEEIPEITVKDALDFLR